MRLISYRGPNAAGGVSSTLTRIFEMAQPNQDPIDWWFLDDGALQRWDPNFHSALPKVKLDRTLIENHYRYCNNFLWPVLHDMPAYAIYNEYERQSYKNLNSVVSFGLRTPVEDSDSHFVNDYQFALVPLYLRGSKRTLLFWHIPWPVSVNPEHTHQLCEIASSLLHANSIGFHTEEYKTNFLKFVQTNLPNAKVHFHADTVTTPDRIGSGEQTTSVVVAPLGLDSLYWQNLAEDLPPPYSIDSWISKNSNNLPYILSVDRCDYTKGVLERLSAIDEFCSSYPQFRGQVRFLQVGSKSRSGLSEFDQYWRSCQQLSQAINSRWSSGSWCPIEWIHEPLNALELASIYKHAAAMIVSPVRDGLNLTAKEFIACQTENPGVLALSSNAGVYTEIGEHCIPIEVNDRAAFAASIARCLRVGRADRYRRMIALNARVRSNSLADWWTSFLELSAGADGDIPTKVCG